MATETPDSKMLCYCRNVNYGAVRSCIAQIDAKTVEQVMASCNAGTGCRTCLPEIQELIDEHKSQRSGFLAKFLRRILSRG